VRNVRIWGKSECLKEEIRVARLDGKRLFGSESEGVI